MLLLDTCVLVWLDTAPAKLPVNAAEAIRESVGIFASSISAFEIAIKHRKGKLNLRMPPEQWFPAVLAAHGIREIGFDTHTAIQSALLPPIHADPFDRIIVATAQVEGLLIVTPDSLITAYPEIGIVW